MRIRNLSPKTQRIYIDLVARCARHLGQSPDPLGSEEVGIDNIYLADHQDVSWSLLNQPVCAQRFLHRITLQKDWAIDHIPFPGTPKPLPVVSSLNEVSQFLGAIHSPNGAAQCVRAIAPVQWRRSAVRCMLWSAS